MSWVAIVGDFDFGKPIAFNGKPTEWQTDQGEKRIGLAHGIAMSDAPFSGGDITATVEFDKISEGNSCEIIFYYDPTYRTHVSAGIGGFDTAFVIRHWDGGQWQMHAATGTRSTLKPKRKYEIKVTLRGSRVALAVDGVDVLGVVLPFSVPPSQAGLFVLDDSAIRVSNYNVQTKKGRVFVVMQFSTPFNEIHEEVIKQVAEEFNLTAYRADETFGPGMIIADIAREIADSEFVIAEITPPNPNVYYELGYSHAINKPVILLADRTMEKLPFDVSPFRVLFYDNSIAGKRQFEDGLRNHIAAILSKNALPAVSGGGLTRR